jgi:hypothetical protein
MRSWRDRCTNQEFAGGDLVKIVSMLVVIQKLVASPSLVFVYRSDVQYLEAGSADKFLQGF